MKRYAIVLDTETAPMVKHSDNNAHPETSLVYDLGFTVIDLKTYETVEAHSMVITDTFFNDNLMNSSYYANKLPQYHNGLGTEWEPVSFLKAKAIVTDACKRYNVEKIYAYNAKFDMVALNNTTEVYSNGYVKYFLPYGVKFYDLWRMAMESGITATKKFVKFATDNNFVTASGNPSTSAETVYRYLTGNINFVERHTALSDAEIETYILCKCLSRKKKMTGKFGCGWMKAAKIKKEME